MPNAKLKAQPRSQVGSTQVRHLRRDGQVPAVLYGKGEEPTHLLVDQQDLDAAIRAKARMIDLEVGGKTHLTFLREVQRDAILETVLHVDFHHVRMDQVLKVKVPLHLKGTPAGVAEGGVVTQLVHEVTVECLPADLPEAVDCRIEHLKLDQSLHLKELSLPARVKAVGDPETILVAVQKPKEEVAPAPAEGEAKEPELIRKEKPEAEGEEKEKGKASEPAKGEKEGKEKGDKGDKEKKK